MASECSIFLPEGWVAFPETWMFTSALALVVLGMILGVTLFVKVISSMPDSQTKQKGNKNGM